MRCFSEGTLCWIFCFDRTKPSQSSPPHRLTKIRTTTWIPSCYFLLSLFLAFPEKLIVIFLSFLFKKTLKNLWDKLWVVAQKNAFDVVGRRCVAWDKLRLPWRPSVFVWKSPEQLCWVGLSNQGRWHTEPQNCWSWRCWPSLRVRDWNSIQTVSFRFFGRFFYYNRALTVIHLPWSSWRKPGRY